MRCIKFFQEDFTAHQLYPKVSVIYVKNLRHCSSLYMYFVDRITYKDPTRFSSMLKENLFQTSLKQRFPLNITNWICLYPGMTKMVLPISKNHHPKVNHYLLFSAICLYISIVSGRRVIYFVVDLRLKPQNLFFSNDLTKNDSR